LKEKSEKNSRKSMGQHERNRTQYINGSSKAEEDKET
jgi:hypothetical protein